MLLFLDPRNIDVRPGRSRIERCYMSTQEGRCDDSKATAQRRRQPRSEPPADFRADVGLPCGRMLQAQVGDVSTLGGACLVFDDDPRLEAGSVVSVSFGAFLSDGEVRHVDNVHDRYRVGIRWLVG